MKRPICNPHRQVGSRDQVSVSDGGLTALLSGESAADRRGFLTEPPVVGLAGLEFGAYTLERPLGQGGMGSVWLARRTDGRFVGSAAVKLMNLALLSPTEQVRFRREGTVLARLTHPGIARLLDAGVAPSGQPYLVIEYVDGQRIDVLPPSTTCRRRSASGSCSRCWTRAPTPTPTCSPRHQAVEHLSHHRRDTGTRGRRATGAMLRARLIREQGRYSMASGLLEGELKALYAEGGKPLQTVHTAVGDGG